MQRAANQSETTVVDDRRFGPQPGVTVATADAAAATATAAHCVVVILSWTRFDILAETYM